MKENQKFSNSLQETEAVQTTLDLEFEKNDSSSKCQIISFEAYKQNKLKEEYHNDITEMIGHLKKKVF